MAECLASKRDTNGEKPAYLHGLVSMSPLFGGAPVMTRTGTDRELMTVNETRAVAEQRVLARRSFSGQPGQVSVARRWLGRLVDGFPAADEVMLACSELAANAIVHSDSGLPGGRFTVRVAIESDIVRVEILDQGGSWSVRRTRSDCTSADLEDQTQCGRGLTIVAAIASSWGISGDQEGRTAWCEIKAQ